MFCAHCGNQVEESAEICPKCGCRVKETPKKQPINIFTIIGFVGGIILYIIALIVLLHLPPFAFFFMRLIFSIVATASTIIATVGVYQTKDKPYHLLSLISLVINIIAIWLINL